MLRGVFGDSSALRMILDRITQLDISRRSENRTQFDRAGFDPGFGYQLGFDGRGDEALNGRFANAAYSLAHDRVNMSVRAPFGLSFTGVYSEREASTWFFRGESLQEQFVIEREWPNIQARWTWNPRAGWVRRFVTNVSTSAALQRRSAVSEYPGSAPGAGLRFDQSSRSTPLSLTLGWAGGINTSFSHTADRTVADRSGSLTRSDRGSNGVDVTFSFRPPREVVPLPSDVRTSLRWLESSGRTCIERAGITGCSAVADSRRSEYNLTMDTHLPPSVSAGLALGWVLSDDRHLNRKFSQFTLTLTGRISFAAGELR